MEYFELSKEDITALNDGDLRELIGRLCEAELVGQGLSASSVTWGGAQEAADGGLDVRVDEKNTLIYPGFIKACATGYQVKKHSMGRQACKKEMLKSGGVKPILSELADKKGAYIIVSGEDDCSDKMLANRLDGMKKAVATLKNQHDLILDFYGRDRVCTWLRQYPSVSLWVRSKLGKPLFGWQPFGRWAATSPDKNDGFLADDYPSVWIASSALKSPQTLVEGINFVREKLLHEQKAIRVIGLSGVGKTRFVQALFENEVGEYPLPRANVIYANLGDDLSPKPSQLVEYLIANNNLVYLILDNCPPDEHRRLQQKVVNATKLRLLTIEYDISDDSPEETEVIHLKSCSEDSITKLVNRRFPELGHINSSRIAEFSGGNARLALALASQVEKHETLTKFSDEELFNKLFKQRKSDNDRLRESAEILSMVYSFNSSQSGANDELAALGRISGIERGVLFKDSAELLRRELAQKRGDWRAVLPHALANRLAKRAFENFPIEVINAELFEKDNQRLFKSCAHRISYLHDCEAARTLAESWIAVGAPLHDASKCSSEQLICLAYIAPTIPEKVLSILEKAGQQPGFTTCSNKSTVTHLLYQLAYDDHLFDRALELLLRFAEIEEARESYASVVAQMRSLFSIFYPGTEALPIKRQKFIEKLFYSPNPTHKKIAIELLDSALKISKPLGFIIHDFGARDRGIGWRSTTCDERSEWYIGFIKLLSNAMQSHDYDYDCVKLAKQLITSNFHVFLINNKCIEVLETIVNKYALGGSWPELWTAICSFDDENIAPDLCRKLEELEAIAAPNDLYSEIETYVLFDIWYWTELSRMPEEFIEKQLLKLSEMFCHEPEYLERLGKQFWEKHTDTLWIFGERLARGSFNQEKTFKLLLKAVNSLNSEKVCPALLRGFFYEVHQKNPTLMQQMLEQILCEPKLKEHFVYLLCVVPLQDWGVQQLIKLVTADALEAQVFVQRVEVIRRQISDENLTKLFDELIKIDDCVEVIVNFLENRFYRGIENNYPPNEGVLELGRTAIKRMLTMPRKQAQACLRFGIDNILKNCFPSTISEAEISEIVVKFFENIEAFCYFGSSYNDLIAFLLENFPKIFIDNFFMENKNKDLKNNLFFDKFGKNYLNQMPVNQLLALCANNQEKIMEIFERIDCFMENNKRIVLSGHVREFIDMIDDKFKVVEIIASKIMASSIEPSVCYGSFASVIDARAEAFRELLTHKSEDVRTLAASKLPSIERLVQEIRELEDLHSREQRFE